MQLHLDLTALSDLTGSGASLLERALLASEPSLTVERRELDNVPAVLQKLFAKFGRSDLPLVKTIVMLLPTLLRGAGVTGVVLPLSGVYKLYVEATADGLRLGIRDSSRPRLVAAP